MTKIYKLKNRKISRSKRIKQIQKPQAEPTEIPTAKPAKIIDQPIEKNKTNDFETKEQGIVTKYYGKKLVRDIDTGEIIELEYFDKAVKHRLKGGWRRVYLEQFLEILTGLTNSKKLDVAEYILSNLNSENQFTQTQVQISEATKISRPVIIETYKYLISVGFMKKTGLCYTINPDYVCAFGSDKKNARILINYHDAEPTLFDENTEI